MNQILINTLSKYNTIIVVWGGTGGHIQPIVSITKSLKKNYTWIGQKDGNEEMVAKENGINFLSIPVLKLSNTRSPKVFLYPLFLILGFIRARKLIQEIRKKSGMATCVFSKGWPGSVAIGLAAWSLHIPLYIHESDTIAGRSNQILAKVATKAFLGFGSAKKYFPKTPTSIVWQILDPVFYQSENLSGGPIQWKTQKPHILVICGSQWSRAIFESIIEQVSGNNTYEWIIALGKLNKNLAPKFSNIPDCQVLDWIDQNNIAELIQDTDIAITRGSATTLAELTAFNKNPKLIIIPLPSSAGNHQYFNALEYEKAWHIILEQYELNLLLTHISHIIQDGITSTKNQ